MFNRKAPLKKDATRIPRESPADKKRKKKSKKGDELKGAVKLVHSKAEKDKKSKKRISEKQELKKQNTIKKTAKKGRKKTQKINKDETRVDSISQARKHNGGERAKPFESEIVAPWGRYVLVVLLLLGVVFGGAHLPLSAWVVQISGKAQAALEPKPRPINSVEVEGEFEYISQKQLQKLLLERVSGDFVNVDIKTIQKELSENEWVYSVAVSRVWPDALKVKIIEQQPIALWGNRGFLNRFGEVIISENLDLIKHLPKLDGDIQNSDEITKQYLHVAQVFAKESLTVTSLSIDEKKSWQVVLDNQFSVVVGQHNLLEKLDNFLFVYGTQLKEHKEQIKFVDLRYEKGIAVSWLESHSPTPLLNKEDQQKKLLSNVGIDKS